MKPPRHHWLVHLYPRAWRDRYGDELSDLIAGRQVDWLVICDVASAALGAHWREVSTRGEKIMIAQVHGGQNLVRTPSAYLPILMSLAALGTVLVSVFLFGARHDADEGAAAHLFQLLVAGQAPLIVWFAVRGRRTLARQAAIILGLQLAAIGLALLPVWYFGL